MCIKILLPVCYPSSSTRHPLAPTAAKPSEKPSAFFGDDDFDKSLSILVLSLVFADDVLQYFAKGDRSCEDAHIGTKEQHILYRQILTKILDPENTVNTSFHRSQRLTTGLLHNKEFKSRYV